MQPNHTHDARYTMGETALEVQCAGLTVAITSDEAQTRFICKACNNHDDLVGIARSVRDTYEASPEIPLIRKPLYQGAVDLLNKLEK